MKETKKLKEGHGRIGTGMNELDRLLGGGFPERTVILLTGAPGTGKTIFGLNYLVQGAAKGHKGCYVSLNETREELLRACAGFHSLEIAPRHMEKELAFADMRLEDIDDIAHFVSILESYPNLDRLVIDNLNKLLFSAPSQREFRLGLSSLIRFLKTRVGCSLLLCETRDGRETENNEAYDCDGVLNLSFLEVEEKPRRILTIDKMRYAQIDARVPREFAIDRRGIRLTGTRMI